MRCSRAYLCRNQPKHPSGTPQNTSYQCEACLMEHRAAVNHIPSPFISETHGSVAAPCWWPLVPLSKWGKDTLSQEIRSVRAPCQSHVCCMCICPSNSEEATRPVALAPAVNAAHNSSCSSEGTLSFWCVDVFLSLSSHWSQHYLSDNHWA